MGEYYTSKDILRKPLLYAFDKQKEVMMHCHCERPDHFTTMTLWTEAVPESIWNNTTLKPGSIENYAMDLELGLDPCPGVEKERDQDMTNVSNKTG